MAQTGGADVVVVRLVDSATRGKMVIVRPGGKADDYSFNAGTSTTNLREGGLTIQRVITNLAQEGYTLKSTFSGVDGVATLVFTKEK